MTKRVFWCLLAVLSLGALSACKSSPERATKVDTNNLADDENDRLQRNGGGRDSSGSPAGGVSPESSSTTPEPAPLIDSGLPVDTGSGESIGDSYPTSWTGVVDDFADRLVRALDGVDGLVVVFPPFGRTPATRAKRDCEFGDLVAERIAQRVAESGRTVWTGQDLESAVHSTNRGLDLVTDAMTAQEMGRRLSAIYQVAAVVSGEADIRKTGRGFGKGVPRFGLRASSPQRGGPRLPSVTGYTASRSEADELALLIEARGQLRYGKDATPFEPQLSGELSFESTRLIASMLSSGSLRGQRVLVEPLEVPRPSGAALRIEQYAQAFRRAFEATRKALEREGVEDAYNRVLEGDFVAPSGFEAPSFDKTFRSELETVGSTMGMESTENTTEEKEWRVSHNITPLQALALYENMKAEFSVSRLGVAGAAFARDVGRALEQVHGGDITIVKPESRDYAVAQIFADSFAARVDDSVDESTISRQQAEAPNFVLRFRVARELDEDYVLSAEIVDLQNANKSRSDSVPLEPWVSRLIDARLR